TRYRRGAGRALWTPMQGSLGPRKPPGGVGAGVGETPGCAEPGVPPGENPDPNTAFPTPKDLCCRVGEPCAQPPRGPCKPAGLASWPVLPTVPLSELHTDSQTGGTPQRWPDSMSNLNV